MEKLCDGNQVISEYPQGSFWGKNDNLCLNLFIFTCSTILSGAIKRKICNVRLQDVVIIRSNDLLAWLGIEDLDLILKERMLRWYGHVECLHGAVKTAFHIQVE